MLSSTPATAVTSPVSPVVQQQNPPAAAHHQHPTTLPRTVPTTPGTVGSTPASLGAKCMATTPPHSAAPHTPHTSSGPVIVNQPLATMAAGGHGGSHMAAQYSSLPSLVHAERMSSSMGGPQKPGCSRPIKFSAITCRPSPRIPSDGSTGAAAAALGPISGSGSGSAGNVCPWKWPTTASRDSLALERLNSHGEDLIVTPFAQILASLRNVRNNYIHITQVPVPTTSR